MRATKGSVTQAQHSFAKIPAAEIQRSVLDRSSEHQTTLNAGYLVPILIEEVLPADTFDLETAAFGRLATLIDPIMDSLWLDFFFFFVPNRLVWDNWERFMGAQDNPDDPTDYLVPVVDTPVGGWTQQTFGDYMGIPLNVEVENNALPFRGFNLIYNEWFRDQNLQDSLPVNKGDGPDSNADYTMVRRGKRHDYFTSCLPWPQKGEAVTVPLGDTAPVVGVGANPTPIMAANVGTATAGAFGQTGTDARWNDGAAADLTWQTTALEANLASATAISINDLRLGFQMQRLLERDARGGTRYTEQLHAHFGVISPDQRLQRPEYLGGATFPLGVQQVEQTAAGTNPVGKLAAYGIFGGKSKRWRKSFVEHGFIIGMCAVRSDLKYQQGLERMWSRQTKYDYYWPALAHLGEQAVLNKEIYAQGDANDDLVFGYQERWAEYRYKPSRVSGRMRSTASQSLDVWHLAQEFASLPVLNDEFIVEDPPVGRVIAQPSQPHVLLACYFEMKCARPMPVYSVPGLIDHF